MENPTKNSKKEFLSNSIEQNLILEELIKRQEANKIIRAYREYIRKKEEKLKNNIYLNTNNINKQDMKKEENNDNELKYKKIKKVHFQNISNQNDNENDSLNYIPDNNESSHNNDNNVSEKINSN